MMRFFFSRLLFLGALSLPATTAWTQQAGSSPLELGNQKLLAAEAALLERLYRPGGEEPELAEGQPAVSGTEVEERAFLSIKQDIQAQQAVPSQAIHEDLEAMLNKLRAEQRARAALEKELSRQKEATTALTGENNRLKRELRAATEGGTKTNQEVKELRNQLLVAETEIERLNGMLGSRRQALIGSYQAETPSPRQPTAQLPPTALKVEEPSTQPLDSDLLIGQVMVDKANLRAGPGEKHSPLMTVGRGTRLAIETRTGDWFRVIAPNGRRAWIASDLLAFGRDGRSAPTNTLRIRGYQSEAERVQLK